MGVVTGDTLDAGPVFTPVDLRKLARTGWIVFMTSQAQLGTLLQMRLGMRDRVMGMSGGRPVTRFASYRGVS